MSNGEERSVLERFWAWAKPKLKKLVCWVVTIVKVFVYIIIFTTAIFLITKIAVDLIAVLLTGLTVGELLSGGGGTPVFVPATIILIIIIVIVWVVIMYFLLKWAKKIFVEEIVTKHCTVFR